MNHKTVQIDLGARCYDIHIGRNLIGNIGRYVPNDLIERHVFIIGDKAVSNHIAKIEAALEDSGALSVKTRLFAGGEKTKSFEAYQQACEWLLEQGLKRDAVIYAVGGGVIGDLAGFVAASVMRGVDFIQVPTTLLSQVDSSVGGKTGINTAQGKNLVGAFYQPRAVIADIDTLETLPQREILAGYAEIAKYGLINDPEFFEWLESHGQDVCALKTEELTRAIEVSVQAKAAIVQEDEREGGKRALLNLGHTFGHVLENAAQYDGRLLHGEAVAIGIVMAHEASARLGLCDDKDAQRVLSHYQKIGLPISAASITPAITHSAQQLATMMQKDKKADRNAIKFILTRGIGQSFITSDVEMNVITDVIKDSLESGEHA